MNKMQPINKLSEEEIQELKRIREEVFPKVFQELPISEWANHLSIYAEHLSYSSKRFAKLAEIEDECNGANETVRNFINDFANCWMVLGLLMNMESGTKSGDSVAPFHDLIQRVILLKGRSLEEDFLKKGKSDE